MKITRDNYESFFMDYLEGNLSEELIDPFLDFLKQNPDLKEELQGFEPITLPADTVVYPGKQGLYKTPGQESFDQQAVAYLEGELTLQERIAFEASLQQDPTLQKEYALFEKTRLAPDPTLRFAGKEKLYKKTGAIVWLNWIGRAAAVLVLLLGIYSLFHKGEDNRSTPGQGEVASIKSPASERPAATEPVATDPVARPAKSLAPAATPIMNIEKQAVTPPVDAPVGQRELLAAREIPPIKARVESLPVDQNLVAIHPLNTEKINDPHNILTLDEYLALRAKKVTNEGILSANKLLRMGLNVASELSGDRLGYTVKQGKVASLGFESKLLAFEIPLEKK